MSRSEPAPMERYHFQQALDPAQNESYQHHRLLIPDGAGAIRIRFRYTPYRVGRFRNLLTLGLFGPTGFRGEAHRGPPDSEITVSQANATPGFIPGPLEAGRWTVQVATHAVLPSANPCTYTLAIEVLPETEPANTANWHLLPSRTVNPCPGWYRGELHLHTHHSDGSWSVGEMLAQAQELKLDFVAVTDHNTISAWGEVQSATPSEILVIPGMELTTFHGHALVLGVNRWIDWRTEWRGWTMTDAALAARAGGGIFVVAHPNRIGAPACTGCRWEYDELDISLVDGTEVWDGPWWREEDDNPANLRLWEQQLSTSARQLTALAGSDAHSSDDWEAGVPFTYVYADELSTQALLEGIRQGRVVLSRGPWVDLVGVAAERESKMGIGDTLVASAKEVQLKASWRGAPGGARLRWHQGNVLLSEHPVSDWGQENLVVQVTPGNRYWIELRANDGSLLALTNPIAVKGRARTPQEQEHQTHECARSSLR